MRARHHLGIFFAGLGCLACRPEARGEPTFDRTYVALDVVKRCKNRTDHRSTTEDREIDTVTIALTDGVHHVNPPTIGCELTARIDGSRLEFRPQSCAAGPGEQSEIAGSAKFDDEGVLEVRLTSVEYWAPSPEFWPDGVWWDCGHDYVLEPLE